MAMDKAHKFDRQQDRNAKNAQRKVFAFSASNSRDYDDDEAEYTNRRAWN